MPDHPRPRLRLRALHVRRKLVTDRLDLPHRAVRQPLQPSQPPTTRLSTRTSPLTTAESGRNPRGCRGPASHPAVRTKRPDCRAGAAVRCRSGYDRGRDLEDAAACLRETAALNYASGTRIPLQGVTCNRRGRQAPLASRRSSLHRKDTPATAPGVCPPRRRAAHMPAQENGPSAELGRKRANPRFSCTNPISPRAQPTPR
jgi:hypothetical protein